MGHCLYQIRDDIFIFLFGQLRSFLTSGMLISSLISRLFLRTYFSLRNSGDGFFLEIYQGKINNLIGNAFIMCIPFHVKSLILI